LSPTVTYGNEKPEGGDQQLNNTFSSIRVNQGNSKRRLSTRASVISISFAKVSTHCFSACVVQLQTYRFSRLLTITVPEIRTRGRNNSNRNALRNTCRVFTS